MKIVVVGGGTAGYISALYMQHRNPEHEITLIENSDIGIIGVGEATTSNFLTMLKNIDIDIKEFMLYSNATIKLGTLFSNWSKENIDFWVPILRPDKIYSKKYLNLISSAIKNDNSLSKIDENPFFALQNKIPKLIEESYEFLDEVIPALNLNTNLCSQYLKNIAKKRNIKIIDDFVNNFKTDSNNNINKIVLSNSELDADFVFDCSGLNRLVIGKFYNEPWISINDTLPINQSVVGQIPHNNNFPPYVKITAMDYGWTFQIPTADRYGVGYNFDSNYLSTEDAVLEVKNKINKNWEPAKTIKYDAGYYQNHFIKNCIAIGLSGSFFEPLEASSIMTAVSVVDEVSNNFKNYLIDQDNFRNKINEHIKNLEQDIVAAIYIHYVTNKTNNDFWKNFTINNKMPKEIKDFLKLMETTIPNPNESTMVNKIGSYYNDYFIKIYYGNGLRNFNVIDKYDDRLYYQYSNFIKSRVSKWKDYGKMLESIEVDLH